MGIYRAYNREFRPVPTRKATTSEYKTESDRLVGCKTADVLRVGCTNGVQMLPIFSAVLNELSVDVAIALQKPLERISLEMVFRSLYFCPRALLRNPELKLIPWLVEHHRSMVLVKAVRQRHRLTAARSLDIWASTLT